MSIAIAVGADTAHLGKSSQGAAVEHLTDPFGEVIDVEGCRPNRATGNVLAQRPWTRSSFRRKPLFPSMFFSGHELHSRLTLTSRHSTRASALLRNSKVQLVHDLQDHETPAPAAFSSRTVGHFAPTSLPPFPKLLRANSSRSRGKELAGSKKAD